ncbi:hypothetical protein [Streptomyces sp. NPDC001307]|uniref:hypothetical protein n=1 Tax=Streptomyces sp. NPDC001307 TaxID=3364560 RepID=UPI0036A05259
MAHLIRAARTTVVVALVTFGSRKLLDALDAPLDHLAAADSDRNPLAGVPGYWAVDAAVIVLYPLAMWAGLRLVRVRGNHLAVVVGFLTWFTLMLKHRAPVSWRACAVGQLRHGRTWGHGRNPGRRCAWPTARLTWAGGGY